jgi:predicted Zn-dependent peptidase
VAAAVLAAVVAAAMAVFAPPALGAPAVHDRTLDNGLRLIVQETPATETVALRLVLLGGALDAPLDRRSLAELHASLLVRSTLTHKAPELSRAVEALGGRLSAGASLRAETVSFDGPAESLEAALRLLAEILREPRLDAYELEKEKGLLAGSIASARDVPGSYLMEETYKALFTGHLFERLVQPTEEEVRAVTIGDVRAFHEGRFGEGRIVLVAVGRCAAEDVERMARAAIGPRQPGRGSALSPLPGVGSHPDEVAKMTGSSSPAPLPAITAPAPLTADTRRRVDKRTTQAEIMVALPTSGIVDDDMPAYVLLRHILGGFQERLYAEIREKRGFAYWVALRGFTMPEAGWFGVHTGANKKNLPAIEQVIRAELARIVKEPVAAEELDRARRYVTTAQARADETNAGRAGTLTGALLDRRPFRTYDESVARLDAVTPAQIQDLARRLFDGRHVAVVTLP